jgi:predicted P-loop ATPase
VKFEDGARDRDHLWAEAVACQRGGHVWWLDNPELSQQAEEEQAARYESDAWDSPILEWADSRIASGHDSVSIVEVLEFCLEKKKADWTKADTMRVGRCLTAAKWERYRDRQRGMEWRYRRRVPTWSGNRV